MYDCFTLYIIDRVIRICIAVLVLLYILIIMLITSERRKERGGNMKIKIKYHNTKIEEIKKIAQGDWIDLRAAETVTIRQGNVHYIDLGVSMQLPKKYEAILAPRSSTANKFGIMCANSFGVIDNSYCGDNDIWKFAAYAIRDTTIHEGDRICQFRIVKSQPRIKFLKVNALFNKNRGGFGSTGIR